MMPLNDDLPEPGPLEDGALRVLSLGGLGEVGRNMNVLETEGKLLIVDCGVLFPEEHQPGVDLILPDMSVIADRLDQVVAVIVTHGHEDHIGAIPYLLKLRPDVPIYGSKFTLALVEAKLAEHRLPTDNLHVVKAGEVTDLPPYQVEYVSVSHSIPDALAVFVRTEAGTVFITGDFKMDPTPLDGQVTDLRAFARIGEEGVDLYMVDSTNAEVPGFVPPEREIGPVLEEIFAQTDGAVVVAAFASHVHRVQQVIDAAYATGRHVAFAGRSMVRNMGIAEELGYLTVPEGVVVDLEALQELPPYERVYMVTGSQGEPLAALARIAAGTHKEISVGEEDTIIFASSFIPGNEIAINRVINDLTARGSRVVHQDNAKVHVSGHAFSGEILQSYHLVQPRNVMPVHGEVRHQMANAKLAASTGVDPANIVVAGDGSAVDLKDGEVTVTGAVPCELVYVDGRSVGEISEDELRERLTLGSEGFVSIFVVFDPKMGKVLAGPIIRAVGVAEDDAVFEQIMPELTKAVRTAAAKEGADSRSLEQAMRRTVGRWVNRRLRRRPMLVPIAVEQ